ncbi:MAG: glycine cleavage system protein T [Beggiatoa sp. IS2]|nr:MAG: glycine cleavage system protein T [Beggiatoa sp. IS2]
MGKKTPLYSKHLQAHAKMLDFAGWEMPWHYGSQLDEHHQVRRDAGMFDITHMTVIDLSGKRVQEFLRILLANDVGRLQTPGQALYSCMLNERGGVIDDLIIYYQQETLFRMITNASTRQKDLAWITRHAKSFGVQVRERDDLGIIAVQGPRTRERIQSVLPAAMQAPVMALKAFQSCWNDDFFVGCTGYTGEDGYEIVLPVKRVVELWDALSAQGIAPIGLGARDTLRLEAGMKLYGTDMDESYSPLESGLANTVAWTPENRNFLGRDALEAQRTQGKHSIMVGLVLQSKGMLRANQTVTVPSGSGRITSGTFSPTLGVAIALARVPVGHYEHVTVTMRNKELSAQVVKPPFARQGKACIDLARKV